MVLLFDQQFVELILEGRKIETRRVWNNCKLKLGSIQTLMCGYSKFRIFGKARIEFISKEKISEMREDDARREGFENLAKFKEYWQRFGVWNPEQDVWVIGFTLLQEESQMVVSKNLASLIESFAREWK